LSRLGSCDSVDVQRFGIGLTIDRVDAAEAADQIALGVTGDSLNLWRAAMQNVPVEVFQYTSEFQSLAETLRAAVGPRSS
jgi:hypothetical protein